MATNRSGTDARSEAGAERWLSEAWAWLEVNSRWLSGVDPRVRRKLRPLAQLRTVPAREPLFRAGDQPAGVFGLFDGMLDVAVPRMDGEEFVFHRAEPGFWIGDLALFSRQQRLVTVRSAADSRLVYLSQSRLSALMRDEPSLVGEFYRLSYDNMEIALKLLGNLSISGADTRIALRLLAQTAQNRSPDEWIRLSQDALADLVALSSQSVRRCLRQFESQGLIECGYGRMRILDRRKLAALCGYS